jgi:hypothetical protein
MTSANRFFVSSFFLFSCKKELICGTHLPQPDVVLPAGIFCGLPNEAERASKDITNYSYTNSDKKILCHFEGACPKQYSGVEEHCWVCLQR